MERVGSISIGEFGLPVLCGVEIIEHANDWLNYFIHNNVSVSLGSASND